MLFHDLYRRAQAKDPNARALVFGEESVTYAVLDQRVKAAALGLLAHGLNPGDRICIYAGQSLEMVIAMLAVSRAGGVFVPVNPVLKARQFAHILADSGARMVIADAGRFAAIGAQIHASTTIVVIGMSDMVPGPVPGPVSWNHLIVSGEDQDIQTDQDLRIEMDAEGIVALLYTSGSTGNPKGVMLSHTNLTTGAASVCQYLDITDDDRLLCVLPLSFDYGLSQVTCALYAGGCAVMINYLFPADVIKALATHRITGLACVPPLWLQLLVDDWPDEAIKHLRYITNSGGQLPAPAVAKLRERIPEAELFLMYGLTEAFRSTFLDPAIIDAAPNAIGRAIPDARIDVVNKGGELCAPMERGELVHSGPLVARGYWQDPVRSARRFKPSPTEVGLAVWSGDIVYRGEDEILYFIGRKDSLIKTSGYRVSPSEIEEVLIAHPEVLEVAIVGVPHSTLGQAIVAVVAPVVALGTDVEAGDLRKYCQRELPSFMVPGHFSLRRELPKNANGKVDRAVLQAEFAKFYSDEER